MNYTLLTNKYGQINIDDLEAKSYIAKTINIHYPYLTIDSIKFEIINDDLLILTLFLANKKEIEINDFDIISDFLIDHLYNNLGLNIKCINIGYLNYGK